MVTKFRTQYQRQKVSHHVGSRLEPSYKISYSDTGSEILKETGVTDVYEQIQSWKDSCDLKTIINRFMQGDVNALNRSTTFFADVADCPTTLAGFLQMRADADQFFMQLPPEVRAEFNSSATEFFAQIGSDRFNSIMAKFNPQPEHELESEVSVDEPKHE